MLALIPRWIRRHGLRTDSASATVANYTFSVFYALIIVIPFYFVLAASFKDTRDIILSPLALPGTFSFEKYLEAIEKADLIKAMGTSLVVVVGVEVSLLLVGFPAAYAIAKMGGRLASISEAGFATGFLIPTFALLLPVFLIIVEVGLLFHPLSLVLVYTAHRLSITVLLLAAVIRKIPREMEEAAVIDGASRWNVMRHIMFPLARPGVITVMILAFIYGWNEFVFALVLLSKASPTVQVALPLLRDQYGADLGLIAAGVVVSMIPVFLMFALFQEKITTGLTTGAIK